MARIHITTSTTTPVTISSATQNPLFSALIEATGTISTTGSDAILATNEAEWYVDNRGTIAGYLTGIRFDGDGSVTNTGSITGATGITGLGASLAVQNAGTINGQYGIVVPTGSAYIANSGWIDGGFGAAFTGASGYVWNDGSGLITGTEYGIQFTGEGSVVNHGIIEGNIGVSGRVDLYNKLTIYGFSFAAVLDSGSTVTNAATGLIRGNAYDALRVSDFVVTNSGRILGPLDSGTDHHGIHALGGLQLHNNASGTIAAYTAILVENGVDPAGPRFDVTNAGLIHGYDTAIVANRLGVLVNAGGTIISNGLTAIDVTNAGGSIDNTGRMEGATYGVLAHADIDINNRFGGRITAVAGYAGIALKVGGHVTNGGVIKGGVLGIDGQSAPITATSSGTITGGLIGVLMDGGSFTNTGFIQGYDKSAIDATNAIISNPGTHFGNILTGGTLIGQSAGITLRGGQLSSGGQIQGNPLNPLSVGIAGVGQVTLDIGGIVTGRAAGIRDSANANRVTLSGTVTATGTGVDLPGQTNQVTVLAGARIAGGTGLPGMRLGAQATVANAGSIAGIRFGANASLDNTGVIDGPVTATSLRLRNAGTLAAGLTATNLDLRNTGRIAAGITTPGITATGGRLVNLAGGTIASDFIAQRAVVLNGGSLIQNGLVTATSDAIVLNGGRLIEGRTGTIVSGGDAITVNAPVGPDFAVDLAGTVSATGAAVQVAPGVNAAIRLRPGAHLGGGTIDGGGNGVVVLGAGRGVLDAGQVNGLAVFGTELDAHWRVPGSITIANDPFVALPNGASLVIGGTLAFSDSAYLSVTSSPSAPGPSGFIVTNTGALTFGDIAPLPNHLRIAPGAVLLDQGVALKAAHVENFGIIVAEPGAPLKIDGALEGGGLRIGVGTTVDITGAATPAEVDFLIPGGPPSALILDTAAAMPGLIDGFLAGDMIDFLAVDLLGSTLSVSGDTLSIDGLKGATPVSFDLHFATALAPADIVVSHIIGGGTRIQHT